ncbi:MAG: hypothetical protein ACRC30_04635 [Clostridium sp.]
MTKGTRVYVWSILGIILISLLAGLYVKKSIVDIEVNDILTNSKEFKLSNQSLINKKEEFKSIDEIYNNSDLVIKGELSGKRKVLDGVVLSELSVKKTYKGECNELIYIYEPVAIVGKNSGYVVLNDGYLPMIENREYIVALNEENFSSEFKFIKGQNSSYRISDNVMGKFPISIDNNSFEINELLGENVNYYTEAVDKEHIFKDQEMLNFYLEKRKQLLNSLD